MREKSLIVLLCAIGLVRLAASADAAIVQYYGADNGIGPPGPFPLSNNAAATSMRRSALTPSSPSRGCRLAISAP